MVSKNETEQRIIEALEREVGGVKVGSPIEIAFLALSVFDKLLDRTPTFAERKKQKYLKLKQRYVEALHDQVRDDNLIGTLRTELFMLVSSYNTEL